MGEREQDRTVNTQVAQTQAAKEKFAEAKAAARAAAFARRDALSAEVRAAKSERICAEAFREIEEHMGTKVGETTDDSISSRQPLLAAYYEIKTEVSMEPLRRMAWEHGWRVALPCVITPGHIEFYTLSRAIVEAGEIPFVAHPARAFSFEEIQTYLQERGLEDECRLVAPEDIDVIVVPLVAFNPDGGRLGYGGGNYDRYVPRMHERALRLGVAFAEQRDDSLQLEAHDCRMSKVITV